MTGCRVAEKKKEGLAVPDFLAVDSGEGSSATAPLELMESVGLNTVNALYILDTTDTNVQSVWQPRIPKNGPPTW